MVTWAKSTFRSSPANQSGLGDPAATNQSPLQSENPVPALKAANSGPMPVLWTPPSPWLSSEPMVNQLSYIKSGMKA